MARSRPSVVFMGDPCTEFGTYDKSFGSIVKQHHAIRDFTVVNVGTGGTAPTKGRGS